MSLAVPLCLIAPLIENDRPTWEMLEILDLGMNGLAISLWFPQQR